jgi:putative Mn2+ efflux pump MntP
MHNKSTEGAEVGMVVVGMKGREEEMDMVVVVAVAVVVVVVGMAEEMDMMVVGIGTDIEEDVLTAEKERGEGMMTVVIAVTTVIIGQGAEAEGGTEMIEEGIEEGGGISVSLPEEMSVEAGVHLMKLVIID